MSSRRRHLMNLRTVAVLTALAVGLGACGGADEAATATETPAATATATPVPPPPPPPTPTEVPPQPFELIESGEFAVGVATIEVIDAERDRPLTVDVWFPLAPDTTGHPQQYTLLPGVYYESPDALVADPADISSGGPFPLVMHSHGSGGLRYIHSSYTEALASHGYIVMAPDHTGNTAIERLADTTDEISVIAANRPQDISAVIDAALNAAHPTAGVFTAHIDADKIAVTGHSFGGYTSYALASGVTIDELELAADTRIDALIALAPATGEALLPDEALARIDIPSMIIVGTDDKTTPIEPNVERPWELSPASPHYRVELAAAEHQTFTDLCEYKEFLPTLENVPELITETIVDLGAEGCSAGDMPSDRAADLTNSFAIGFLDEVFTGAPPLDLASLVFPDDVTVLQQ